MAESDLSKVLLIVLAILIPPLAVGLKEGIGTQLLINIVLLVLTFGLGAIIHALWIVLR